MHLLPIYSVADSLGKLDKMQVFKPLPLFLSLIHLVAHSFNSSLRAPCVWHQVRRYGYKGNKTQFLPLREDTQGSNLIMANNDMIED